MKTERTIVIASTFTAEPVGDSIHFWLERMEMPGRISFVPQNQLFQTLLDPRSPFALNDGGLNVVLMRWEDLDPAGKSAGDRLLDDFIDALNACSGRAKTPHLLITCPASPSVTATGRHHFYEQWDGRLADAFAANPGICVVRSEILQELYPAATVHDSGGDRLASIPYSPAMFAAVGTMISRKFHMLTTEPYKAIVVDCDGTLWSGVCGEDGPQGVRLEPSRLALQEFLISQSRRGVLICLCSKNNEDDVEAVFCQRADMPLRREHLTASRVNWADKRENLLSIAEELGFGAESFIFLDDSPMECEAMRQFLPNVLTLQLPADPSGIPGWLRRIWAFDRPAPTDEDRQRTFLYHQERERQQLRRHSTTLEEFLAGLELQVTCIPLDPDNLARAAQLTFRVNQFNLTTIRRTEGELGALLREGSLNGFTVEVSDRFGDYGLVGLVLYSLTRDALEVDTFLLSCRALGRGVEHRILAELAKVAKFSGSGVIGLRVIPSGKNQPAREFLETNLGSYRQRHARYADYRVPVDVALTVHHYPENAMERSAGLQADVSVAGTDGVGLAARRAQRLAWIASEMLDADGILAALQDGQRRDRPDESGPVVSPATEPEKLLAEVWAGELGLKEIGVRDNFFSLGGDSLMIVRIIIRLYESTGVEFPVSAFFESPTIEEQAVILAPLLSATSG